MSKRKKPKEGLLAGRQKRQNASPSVSRASEAITIAWTVSVTGVVISNFVLLAAIFYARGNPSQPVRMFEAIMLLSAAAMGALSLALVPVVWRSRRLKPPVGYTLFAIVVSAAPVAMLISRLLQ